MHGKEIGLMVAMPVQLSHELSIFQMKILSCHKACQSYCNRYIGTIKIIKLKSNDLYLEVNLFENEITTHYVPPNLWSFVTKKKRGSDVNNIKCRQDL